jgi:hypothetical protein
VRKPGWWIGIAVATAAMLAAASAGASTSAHLLKASLSPKAAVPAAKDAAAATGSLSAKLTVAGKKSSFVWTLTVKHLSGAPTKATIYYGKPGKVGQVALPLCVKCQTPSTRGAYIGSYVASSTFVRAMLHGGAYVEVATRKNPKGEVRGQIRVG